uniref:Epidermal growth factor receptor n=1 Tax=Romanomermis culicivorax TaxID=13658 RepID=A0A915J962_ROMCU
KSIVDGITENDLESLSNIHTVTDCIFIQSRQYLRSIKFLRNLETVEGRRSCQGHDGGTFVVGGNTNLTEMGTPKLKQVKSGKVFIGMNENLCGVDSIPFNDSIAPERSTVKSNAPKPYCDSVKYCHESCDQTKGCWGRGPGMCFECAKFKLHDNCINWCNSSESLYIAAEKECDFCHAECITCNGPGAHNCTQCKNVELDGECVQTCPVNFYFVDNDKKCRKCHENCHNYGCTGPGNFVGLGGCNKCDFALVDKYGTLTECIHSVSIEKPCSRILNQTNFFWGTPSSNDLDPSVVNKIEKGICRPCHPECESCTNFGQEEKVHGCVCKNYRVFSNGYYDG